MKLNDYIESGATEGERNNAFFCAILQAREAGWAQSEIESTLCACARRDGLDEPEIMATLKSAMNKTLTPRQRSDGERYKMEMYGDWFETLPESEKTNMAIEYLEALYEPQEIVSIVNQYAERDGGMHPIGKGYCQARETIINRIKKEKNAGAALCSDKKAGLWCRINPVNGDGVKDENVTDYRHCLVESDKIDVAKQLEIINKLNVPCAAIVHSGGKSIHAIVKINAGQDRKLYDTRVRQLYEALNAHGMEVDRQNRNPSRLSRMPGVMRNGKLQSLISTDCGFDTWEEFEKQIVHSEVVLDEDPVNWAALSAEPPVLDREIIEGILRKGHKLLLGGPSKAGKSFALIQLAAAMASGTEWLGYRCREGRVLYVNLEIAKPSFIQRVMEVEKLKPFPKENLCVWNLRGKISTMRNLMGKLTSWTKEQAPFDLIIIDPIYKINEGDENSAKDMTVFCNALERVAFDTGAAIAFAHHFSKGAQGGKASIDRASGSGVFGRDPDAIGTLTQIENTVNGYALEWTLREFRTPSPMEIYFEYPVHRVQGTATIAKLEGAAGRKVKIDKNYDQMVQEYTDLHGEPPQDDDDLAVYFGVSLRTIQRKRQQK